MTKLHVPWLRSLRPLVAVPTLVLLAGCLSPKTIQPIARHNEENLAHYTANVTKVAEAFVREDALLREILLHQTRESVAKALVPIRQSILLPATDPKVLDAAQSWVTTLQQSADSLKPVVRAAGDQSTRALLAAQHPVLYDLAAGTPGFTAQRIVQDSLALDELNNRMVNETEPAIARVYQQKRTELLTPYAPVQRQLELNQMYQEALGQFLATLEEQAAISRGHAQALIGYAQAEPALGSLKTFMQDEGLRQAVLGLVAKKNGRTAADELSGNFGKLDQVIDLISAK